MVGRRVRCLLRPFVISLIYSVILSELLPPEYTIFAREGGDLLCYSPGVQPWGYSRGLSQPRKVP
jgi:hypothetical protein